MEQCIEELRGKYAIDVEELAILVVRCCHIGESRSFEDRYPSTLTGDEGLREIILNLLRGTAIGVANIIPGVSGGTMALVLGIYSRLLTAIGSIGGQTARSLLSGRQAIAAEWRRVDAFFLVTIGVGAVVAIVALARLMTYLLAHQHDPTYGFFCGLVVVSVIVPYRMIRRFGPGTIVSCVAAIALVVGLSLAMSGEERLASAQQKVALKAAAANAGSADGAAQGALAPLPDATSPPSGTTRVAPGRLLLFFGAGAVAISAMILPGISGSFVLLLMGLYFEILGFIVERQLLPLAIFALGCLTGLALFTRLLRFLLARFNDLTMAFLLGLLVGSIYAIWPFKNYGMAGSERIDLDPILPTTFGANEALTFAAAVGGGLIVAIFVWIEMRNAPREKIQPTNR